MASSCGGGGITHSILCTAAFTVVPASFVRRPLHYCTVEQTVVYMLLCRKYSTVCTTRFQFFPHSSNADNSDSTLLPMPHVFFNYTDAFDILY